MACQDLHRACDPRCPVYKLDTLQNFAFQPDNHLLQDFPRGGNEDGCSVTARYTGSPRRMTRATPQQQPGTASALGNPYRQPSIPGLNGHLADTSGATNEAT
ncbi:hypothetical protein PCASD_00967 [Puccinia coronata f. sp. avenae]|uniref:Uncharacterized protein n=1 Tax=Puccinia coronata f. sp. avenae TaxID=200324 RepID=A0A2N5VMK7_9BASI|nr:hypothetical protein PCASD_22826 [Puccinia coronata f. sp. avenae]PLW51224.1 hypothetical protein PCASD_00967 [Puccinia coronata f. sp. avenae]